MSLFILISDLLWWLIMLALGLSVVRIYKHRQLANKWLNILNQPVAMICFCVIAFFVLITCLDSLHVKVAKTNHVQSILDIVLKPLSNRLEQSYSSPFAVYTLNKVNTNQQSQLKRLHSRLKYAGRNFDEQTLPDFSDSDTIPTLVKYDILSKAAIGIFISFVICTIGLLPIILAMHLRFSQWRTMKSCFISLCLIISIFSVSYYLSLHYHVFGTDKVGNDVFIDVIKGTRTAVLIGTLTTVVLLPLAILMGISAGYFRGLVDDAIQYIYTTLNSIPGILLIASAILLLQVFIDNNNSYFDLTLQRSDARLILLCAILGLTSWTGLCRLLRAETLKLRSLEFVEAARAFGLSNWQLLLQHILPNLLHIVLIVIVLDFSGLVLAEAVLAYVGVGVDPIMPSWGNMINNARMEIAKQPPVWWSLLATFTFMFSLVLAANLFADAIKKEFDPRYNSKK